MIAARIVILALMAVLSGFAVHTASSSLVSAGETIQGDADCNGTVATPDLGVVLRAAAGATTGSGCVNQTGNVNCTAGFSSSQRTYAWNLTR